MQHKTSWTRHLVPALVALLLGLGAVGLLARAGAKPSNTLYYFLLPGSLLVGAGLLLARAKPLAGQWLVALGGMAWLSGLPSLMLERLEAPQIWYLGLYHVGFMALVPAAAALGIWALARAGWWRRTGRIAGSLAALALLGLFLVPAEHLAVRRTNNPSGPALRTDAPLDVQGMSPEEALLTSERILDFPNGEPKTSFLLLRQEASPALTAWEDFKGDLAWEAHRRQAKLMMDIFFLADHKQALSTYKTKTQGWSLMADVLGPPAFWTWNLVLLSLLVGSVAVWLKKFQAGVWAAAVAAVALAYVPLANLALLALRARSNVYQVPAAAVAAMVVVEVTTLVIIFFLARPVPAPAPVE